MTGGAAPAAFSRREERGVTILAFHRTHYYADSFNALGKALTEAISEAGNANLIVDLNPVLLLSSTALRALRMAHLSLSPGGGRIVAVGGGELVAGVLKFAPFMDHYPDLDSALAALDTAREPRKGDR